MLLSLSGVLNNLFMSRHVTPPVELVNDTRVVILHEPTHNKHCMFILRTVVNYHITECSFLIQSISALINMIYVISDCGKVVAKLGKCINKCTCDGCRSLARRNV